MSDLDDVVQLLDTFEDEIEEREGPWPIFAALLGVSAAMFAVSYLVAWVLGAA